MVEIKISTQNFIAQHSDKASTNLHLDMSDAVNCLVYVSSPQDMDPKKEAEGVLREIEESGKKNFIPNINYSQLFFSTFQKFLQDVIY